ncbi:MAG: hypothetical protein ACT443_11420 [Gemmatimonadota bacterium]
MKGGTRVAIQFLTPHVAASTYDLDDVAPGFFDEFAAILAPDDEEPQLTLARYGPSRYSESGEIKANGCAPMWSTIRAG